MRRCRFMSRRGSTIAPYGRASLHLARRKAPAVPPSKRRNFGTKLHLVAPKRRAYCTFSRKNGQKMHPNLAQNMQNTPVERTGGGSFSPPDASDSRHFRLPWRPRFTVRVRAEASCWAARKDRSTAGRHGFESIRPPARQAGVPRVRPSAFGSGAPSLRNSFTAAGWPNCTAASRYFRLSRCRSSL